MINWYAIGGSPMGFAAFVVAMTAYAVVLILLPMFRILGCKTQAFQAIAHLVVGGMFGAWMAGAPRVCTLYPAFATFTRAGR